MVIRNIQLYGNLLRVTNVDGTIQFAYPASTELYVARTPTTFGGTKPVSPGAGGGGMRLNPESSIPNSLTGAFWDGSTVTYSRTQCTHAYWLVAAALNVPGITKDGVLATLMCALVESVLWRYANSNVPESLDYPHDLVGSDHDSVGFFQQRPSAGWGSIGSLMSYEYSTRAFLGGPSGPNSGSPAGLFDISPPWTERATLGTAVQAVQISAHPSRYDNVRSTAEQFFDLYVTLETTGGGSGCGVIDPFPGGYDASDPFGGYAGGRTYPHTGSDWNAGGAVSGAPIPAITCGTVEAAGWSDGNGNYVSVKMANHPVYYAYLHMIEPAHVSPGQYVETGQILGRVGNTGTNSRGAHLHVTMSDQVTAYIGLGNRIDPYAWIVANSG